MKFHVTLNGERYEVNDTPIGLLLNGDDVGPAALRLHDAGDNSADMVIGQETFRVNFLREGGNGKTGRGKDVLTLWVNGERFEVQVLNERAVAIEKFAAASGDHALSQKLIAPMPGLIVRVSVAVGDPVPAGHGLIVMEAMKMENELRASRAGVVKSVHVEPGRAVEKGTLLVELDPPA